MHTAKTAQNLLRAIHKSSATTHRVRASSLSFDLAAERGVTVLGVYHPAIVRNSAGGQDIAIHCVTIPMPRSAAQRLAAAINRVVAGAKARVEQETGS